MKRVSMGVGLQSAEEDWHISLSLSGLEPEPVRQIGQWLYRAACGRLGDGGWHPPRPISLSVTAHGHLTRIVDECCEVTTQFTAAEARLVIAHCFIEAMRFLEK